MKGFTLIELLVVVLIIGILSSVALPQYNKAVEKSRQSEAWTTMKSINDAVKIYQMEKSNATAVPTFGDMSVAFVHTDGASAGKVADAGSVLNTKTFTYTIKKDGVIAARQGGSFGAYNLGLNHTGSRTCSDASSGNICLKIGGKAGTVAATDKVDGMTGTFKFM